MPVSYTHLDVYKRQALQWHFTFMWFFAASGAVYVLSLIHI